MAKKQCKNMSQSCDKYLSVLKDILINEMNVITHPEMKNVFKTWTLAKDKVTLKVLQTISCVVSA